MKVIDPGHLYLLRLLDTDDVDEWRSLAQHDGEYLQFVKREGPGYPGNEGHYPGTTMQEVLRALIDRTKYVDNQIHDDRNDNVLFHLRMAIFHLEKRAAERHGRELPKPFNIFEIEHMEICEKCNHIGCPGTCH